MMRIMSWIKFCDILSPKLSLLIDKSERFKTVLGGIFSSSIIIISIFAFIWFFALLIQKTDFIVVSNNSFNTTLNYTFKSQDRLFMFNALTSDGLRIENQERIFTITSFNLYFNYKKDSNGEITQILDKKLLQVAPCTLETVSPYLDYLSRIDYSDYYCLAPNQTVHLENTPQSTDYYKTLNVYYSPCVNSTLNNNFCFDINIIKEKMRYFYNRVVIMNTYFDNNNQTNPIQYYATPLYDPSSFGFFTQKYFYFQKFNYMSDDGFVFANPRNYVNLISQETSYSIADSNNQTHIPFAFFANKFQMQPISININRTYKKAQTVLGEIGGFVNFLLLFSSLITNYVGTKELQFNIFNNSVKLFDKSEIKKTKILNEYRLKFNRVVSDNLRIKENEISGNGSEEFPKVKRTNGSKLRKQQNFTNYSNFKRINEINQYQLHSLKFIDYLLIITFGCYKRNTRLRSYNCLIEKKILKLLDISNLIRLQLEFKHIVGTLFQTEKHIFQELSDILIYDGKVKINEEKNKYSMSQLNNNENLGFFLDNLLKKFQN